MFYFPLISSRCEINELENKVNKKLEGLYKDLEQLIFWEKKYNYEATINDQAKHIYLKNVIDGLLDKDN